MRLANFPPRISSSTCYRKEPSDLLTSMAGIISVFLQLVHFMPDWVSGVRYSPRRTSNKLDRIKLRVLNWQWSLYADRQTANTVHVAVLSTSARHRTGLLINATYWQCHRRSQQLMNRECMTVSDCEISPAQPCPTTEGESDTNNTGMYRYQSLATSHWCHTCHRSVNLVIAVR